MDASRRRKTMKTKITPFLMFNGKAEEALRFYRTVFPNSTVRELTHYRAGEAGPVGSVKRALFTLAGQDVMCIDSPVRHDFSFTPAMSLFVECDSAAQLDDFFAQLGAGGKTLMAPDAYGFSRKFAWVSDRYGVSWQLNLA
jgi:predicted 3-demethylubiquinone-9 3-methyltransferase (glyoxalase superfamily)